MPSIAQAVQHIVIVEPNADGHRMSYVADLARFALEGGHRVTLVLPEGAPEVPLHLGNLATRCEVVAHDGRHSLSKLSVQLSSDLLVVPDGDRVAIRLGVGSLGRHAWTGHGSVRILLMRWGQERADSSVISRARQFIKRAAIRRASRLDGVGLVALASATGAAEAEWLPLAPDPVRVSADPQMSEELRAKWGVAGIRPVVAIVGALDRRKNIPIVLDAIALTDRHDIVTVLAGRIEASVLGEITPKIEALRESGFDVVVENRNLSDRELDSTIAAADYVILAHSNEVPSGILGKAMVVGTGIIAAGANSLRQDVERLDRGLDTWHPLSPVDLASALDGVGIIDHSGRLRGPGSQEFAISVLGLSHG